MVQSKDHSRDCRVLLEAVEKFTRILAGECHGLLPFIAAPTISSYINRLYRWKYMSTVTDDAGTELELMCPPEFGLLPSLRHCFSYHLRFLFSFKNLKTMSMECINLIHFLEFSENVKFAKEHKIGQYRVDALLASVPHALSHSKLANVQEGAALVIEYFG